MLIEMILDVLYGIFSTLTAPIQIPSLPSTVHSFMSTGLSYVTAGASLVANYIHLTFFLSVFAIILLVDIGINLYHFVMWILRKIPVLGIE